jgi:selenocysteine lyase/cysteine desulfurase
MLLDLLHCNGLYETVFMPSATIALNTILRGLNLSKTDTVYISHFEHNSVTRVLYYLQKTIGFKLEYIEVTDNFKYDLDAIKRQFINNKPALVVMSHVSNVCGLIAPVEDIAKLAKGFEAVTVVDGAQACGVIDINLQNIDYYVFAGHKTLLGPFGVAGFVCRKNSSLKSFVLGGTGVDSANKEMPSTIPERFEAGSQNLMAIAGLNYSLKWRNSIGIKSIHEKEKKNYDSLYAILSAYDFIKIYGDKENSSAIISCNFKDYSSDEAGRILNNYGIAVRTGLQCAPDAHRFLGTFPEGTVRFSISYFTNEDDLKNLKSALDEIEEQL